jgi:hypothetical protein
MFTIPVEISRNKFRQIEMFAHACLSTSSYLFHNGIYKEITNNDDHEDAIDKMDLLSDRFAAKFYFDIFSIHFRCFCAILAMVRPEDWNIVRFLESKWEATASQQRMLLMLVSLAVHIYTIGFICEIGSRLHKSTSGSSDTDDSDTTDDEDQSSHDQIRLSYTDKYRTPEQTQIWIAHSAAIFIDICIIMYLMESQTLKASLFLNTCWLFFIKQVEPFYRLNHVAIHIGLMFQTWIISRAH